MHLQGEFISYWSDKRDPGAEVPELKAESFRVALEGSQIFPSSQL